ncbi:hypothetical protein JCM8547_005315, partial [Rhodosporidiobolus lusitaniae]
MIKFLDDDPFEAHIRGVEVLISTVAEEIDASGSNFTLPSSDPRNHHEAARYIDSEHWCCEEQGEFSCYKVHLVAQGFNQQPGISFREMFTPIAKFTLICILVAVAARNRMLIHQADIHKAQSVKLDRALYGLKQAGRVWKLRIHASLVALGNERTQSDACVYKHLHDSAWHYTALYVDDLLFVSESLEEINRVKGGSRPSTGLRASVKPTIFSAVLSTPSSAAGSDAALKV